MTPQIPCILNCGADQLLRCDYCVFADCDIDSEPIILRSPIRNHCLLGLDDISLTIEWWPTMKPSISTSLWMFPTPAVSVGSAEASVGLNGTRVSSGGSGDFTASATKLHSCRGGTASVRKGIQYLSIKTRSCIVYKLP